MFDLKTDADLSFWNAFRLLRKPRTLAVAATLSLAVFGTSCFSPGTSQQKPPAQTGSTPSADQSGGAQTVAQQGAKLTVEQLGDALTSYGKNTVNDNGQVVYSITVPSGKWKINVIISMSPNGNVIWMTNSLTAMPAPDKTSLAAMVNVLKKNRDIGPMFFEIAGDSLALTYPVPNHDMTEASFKTFVDSFVSTVVDNAQLWDPATVGR